VLVLASRPGIGALLHAAAFKVPARVKAVQEVTAALDAVRPDLVVMAGYLSRWPPPKRYLGRTINIHPALLPSFGGRGFFGRRVHQAVLLAGRRTSGCSVHFVTSAYDQGPIIAQREILIPQPCDADKLAHLVFQQELLLLPAVIRALAAGRVGMGRIKLGRKGVREEKGQRP